MIGAGYDNAAGIDGRSDWTDGGATAADGADSNVASIGTARLPTVCAGMTVSNDMTMYERQQSTMTVVRWMTMVWMVMVMDGRW